MMSVSPDVAKGCPVSPNFKAVFQCLDTAIHIRSFCSIRDLLACSSTCTELRETAFFGFNDVISCSEEFKLKVFNFKPDQPVPSFDLLKLMRVLKNLKRTAAIINKFMEGRDQPLSFDPYPLFLPFAALMIVDKKDTIGTSCQSLDKNREIKVVLDKNQLLNACIESPVTRSTVVMVISSWANFKKFAKKTEEGYNRKYDRPDVPPLHLLIRSSCQSEGIRDCNLKELQHLLAFCAHSQKELGHSPLLYHSMKSAKKGEFLERGEYPHNIIDLGNSCLGKPPSESPIFKVKAEFVNPEYERKEKAEKGRWSPPPFRRCDNPSDLVFTLRISQKDSQPSSL